MKVPRGNTRSSCSIQRSALAMGRRITNPSDVRGKTLFPPHLPELPEPGSGAHLPFGKRGDFHRSVFHQVTDWYRITTPFPPQRIPWQSHCKAG